MAKQTIRTGRKGATVAEAISLFLIQQAGLSSPNNTVPEIEIAQKYICMLFCNK